MAGMRSATPGRLPKEKVTSPKNEDSPSRQLMFELSRAMGQIQMHENELKKVRAYNRRSYYEDLDSRDRIRTQSDLAALDAATARHDAVRQEAEAELRRYYREAEEEQRRKEEEEEERLRREKDAFEQSERERKERYERERKAKLQREQAAAAAKRAAEEKAKADAEEAKRKEREETAARKAYEKEKAAKLASGVAATRQKEANAKAAQEAAIQETAAATQYQAASHSLGALADLEARHKRYLQIHQSLKKFRKDFVQHSKGDKDLKTKVGEMRRAIKTSVGQLADAKGGANTTPTARVRTIFLAALREIRSPPVTLADYLAFPTREHAELQIPTLLLYLFNIFSKAIVACFTGEGAVNPRAAEPAGTLVAQLFSVVELNFPPSTTTTVITVRSRDPKLPPTTRSELQPEPGQFSLIDILLAKLHHECPVLFGIYGPETTVQGKLRLGWHRELPADGSPTKQFVLPQRHFERMTGLGAGFAAISLRNFARANRFNPYPPKHYWESLSNMLNVPPEHVTATHLVVLKNMIVYSVGRFILFYDGVAIAALRNAIVDFPARLPTDMRESNAGRALVLVGEMLRKEENLSLT